MQRRDGKLLWPQSLTLISRQNVHIRNLSTNGHVKNLVIPEADEVKMGVWGQCAVNCPVGHDYTVRMQSMLLWTVRGLGLTCQGSDL